MRELIRTNDVVLVSYLEARLKEADIDVYVLDSHTSILEGSLGILPRRVMVPDEQLAEAKVLLHEVQVTDLSNN